MHCHISTYSSRIWPMSGASSSNLCSNIVKPFSPLLPVVASAAATQQRELTFFFIVSSAAVSAVRFFAVAVQYQRKVMNRSQYFHILHGVLYTWLMTFNDFAADKARLCNCLVQMFKSQTIWTLIMTIRASWWCTAPEFWFQSWVLHIFGLHRYSGFSKKHGRR